MKRFKVSMEKKIPRSYEVYIGQDILDRAALLIAKGNWAKKYYLITDSHVSRLHGQRVAATFENMGLPLEMIVFPGGEKSKTMTTALTVAEELLRRGADRTSGLIALGGGVTGDLTGFVASIFMRGIPYIQFPTTLMAQVDSSIGGKTGVDMSGAKNMLGTFHQPKAVFSDLAFLATLPAGEFKNGLAEIVKCAIIDDPGLLELLEEMAPAAINSSEADSLGPIIARTCEIKKRIVEIDEHEHGLRRILNFGHTLGHAIEAEAAFTIPHGEAVAMGMAGAVKISEKRGHLTAADGERIIRLLQKIDLPVRVPAELSSNGMLSKMKRDKKKEGNIVPFVLLKKPGMPFINGGVPEITIREVLEAMKK